MSDKDKDQKVAAEGDDVQLIDFDKEKKKKKDKKDKKDKKKDKEAGSEEED